MAVFQFYSQTLKSMLIFTFMVFFLKTYLNYKYISNEEALKSSSAAGSPVTVMDNVQISDFVDLFFFTFLI